MKMKHKVHFSRGFQGDLAHPGLKQVTRLQEAGQIMKDELGVGLSPNPGDWEPSCLRLGADQGQVLPHEGIQEGGLADIGGAGEGDVAGSWHLWNIGPLTRGAGLI